MGINDHASNIREMIFNDLEKAQQVIFPGLLDTTPMAAIPESVFVNYFLPGFLGTIDTTAHPNWVLDWISVAGSPMAEVSVIDDTTKEVLYVVPGILYTNNLFTEKHEGDLGDIFTRYEQISGNGQGNGFSFLVNALHAKNSIMLTNNSLKQVNDKWAIILQRYNYISQDTPQDNAPEVDTLSDALEY